MNIRSLILRVRALIAPGRVERDLDEELAFHVERETHKHVAAGLSRAEARARALRRFGSMALAADECRDARGIAFVDDLRRDVHYALRTLRRAPVATLTVVATVALGLGLVTVVFTVYSFLILRVDAVRNPGELFAVNLQRWTGTDDDRLLPFARRDYEAMRRETALFAEVFATRESAAPHVDGRPARPVLVTGNFFQALGVQAALGRALLPDDDQPFAGRPVIVLSHAGWHKLFRGDPTVIGRRVSMGGAPHEIVGIMPEAFRGLALRPPDCWAPLALAGETPRSTDQPIEIIGRLKSGVSREAAAAALSAWASARAEFEPRPGFPIQASLTPRQGTMPGEGFGIVFSPLFFAFGLILLIGCANVANLLLARGVSRQREIGTRLSLGASRARIVRQLLTESLLVALLAGACALALSRLFLEGALYAVITTLPPEIAHFVSLLNVAAPTQDWRVVVFVAAGAVVSTVFFGLAPALNATRLDLVRTMRGEVMRDARPGRARQALIAAQVGASALLLICSVVFLRGAFAAATRDPGIRTIDTVAVNIDDESQRGAVLQALASDPSVAAIAASSLPARATVSGLTSPDRMPVARLAVSSGYFDVLGIDLVDGRGFTPAERTLESGVAVVSETVARQLWPNGGGVGQSVRVDAPQAASTGVTSMASRTLTVVGVARDAQHRGVYVPTGVEAAGIGLTVRVRGNPDQVRVELLQRLPGLDPGFGVMTLRSMTGMETYLLQLAFSVSVVLGGLALVLTISGLYGVLSYVVEQQAKEIGVRMALGAAAKDVARLVLSQSLRPVAIGLAAGSGLAMAVAIVLISTPLAAEIGDSIDVRDPVAYVAGLLVIVTSCALAVSLPALRAARIDPIATLRKD